MIFGVGTDAVSIERIGRLNERAIQRIFNPREVEEYKALEHAQPQIKAQFLASRFAVKEAYAKARGLGFGADISPSEICTCKDKEGKPYIELTGHTLEKSPSLISHVSITHEMPLAIAFVVLETVEA
ncbi:MAG: holo-ACP synthase [Sphaerochaetaceae bacterium]|nr:holo-ACP synthase [Sphaerochaetaceae bacterium]